MGSSFSIANKTSKRIPRALLRRVFSLVSKKRTMEVSLVFLGNQAMQNVNRKWRKQDAQANVLAFPLDASVGEVVINPQEAEREARREGVSYNRRVAYLFLHGLLHLYGYDHTKKQDVVKMEKKEHEILKKAYSIN
ncbi:MAG: putative rRNA maturation factor [Parcubacteria group bacterium Gr01-1014_70]|nr:MAG: putative rRNA maturation factor [Parcubacteria group bacterium Gr01-1014_70]